MLTELAQPLDAELAKRWHDRRLPRLRRLYDAEQARALRRNARFAIWFVGLLYILFSVTDAVLIGDVLGYAVAMRVAIGLTYALGIGLQIRRGVAAALIELQCALGVVVGYGAWLVLTTLSAETANVLYYIAYGIVFMMVSNLFFNFRFVIALITSGSITAIFFVVAIFVYPTSMEYRTAIGSLYVLSLILTLFINWKLDVERYRVFLNALRAEIRQREASERGDALLKLSITDALTGLANRRAADAFLQELWQDWNAAAAPFAVILIDIDYFKMFNDHYGHQEGDACLVSVAHAMEQVTARHRCRLGRFGGEEFILLLPCGTADHAMTVAEEVRGSVQDLRIPHQTRSDHLSVVTVSVGAAFCGDVAGEKPERIVTGADRALYLAKDSNRNCVKRFDARLLEAEITNDAILDLVRTAIAQDRISVAYQPIWNVGTGHMLAAEALMRLTAADGRSVSPAVFIPVAERSGAIVELGTWMMRAACRQLAANAALPIVSVNVSAVQIGRSDFAASVSDILRETGIGPSRLAIEITEGAEIGDNAETAQAVADLTGLGVRVWLDDFGTGFAGLSCLSKIRFHTVKIDRMFVQASDTPRGAKLLKDIVDLVRNSGHDIVVEGVESREQVDLLKACGVDVIQGYYFNRPMSPDALTLLTLKDGTLAPTQAA